MYPIVFPLQWISLYGRCVVRVAEWGWKTNFFSKNLRQTFDQETSWEKEGGPVAGKYLRGHLFLRIRKGTKLESCWAFHSDLPCSHPSGATLSLALDWKKKTQTWWTSGNKDLHIRALVRWPVLFLTVPLTHILTIMDRPRSADAVKPRGLTAVSWQLDYSANHCAGKHRHGACAIIRVFGASLHRQYRSFVNMSLPVVVTGGFLTRASMLDVGDPTAALFSGGGRTRFSVLCSKGAALSGESCTQRILWMELCCMGDLLQYLRKCRCPKWDMESTKF